MKKHGYRQHTNNTTLAPPLRPKRRLAPRGKPFEKGNAIDLATRFQAGICPNPGGRPASAKVGEASRVALALSVDEPLPRNTNAEDFVSQLVRKGRRGNLAAIREIVDRAEGRPAQALTIDDGPDPLTELVRVMEAKVVDLGPVVGDEIEVTSEEEEETNE